LHQIQAQLADARTGVKNKYVVAGGANFNAGGVAAGRQARQRRQLVEVGFNQFAPFLLKNGGAAVAFQDGGDQLVPKGLILNFGKAENSRDNFLPDLGRSQGVGMEPRAPRMVTFMNLPSSNQFGFIIAAFGKKCYRLFW